MYAVSPKAAAISAAEAAREAAAWSHNAAVSEGTAREEFCRKAVAAAGRAHEYARIADKADPAVWGNVARRAWNAFYKAKELAENPTRQF